MRYTFTKRRCPSSDGQLSAIERGQLVRAWEYYCGDIVDAERLVAENPEWFELWGVEQQGRMQFDYWHIPPDSGTLFYAGEVVPTGIRVVQFGWDVVEYPKARSPEDMENLAQMLADAWRARQG